MWSSSSVTKDSVRQGASVRGGRVQCAARLPGHRYGSGVLGVVQQRRRGAVWVPNRSSCGARILDCGLDLRVGVPVMGHAAI
jgi:hypothetical protein